MTWHLHFGLFVKQWRQGSRGHWALCFPTQNNKAEQPLVGGCALMEMSNWTNNVAPNLYRERNQLHSSMHPSMLFIRVSVLLKQPLHPPDSHTHTQPSCACVCARVCVATGPTHTCTRYKVAPSHPPNNRRVGISGPEGGMGCEASKHGIRVNVPSLGYNLFRGGLCLRGLRAVR